MNKKLSQARIKYLQQFFGERSQIELMDNYMNLIDEYWKQNKELKELKNAMQKMKERYSKRPLHIIESHFDVYFDGVLQPWKIPADFEVIDTKDCIMWGTK